MSAGEEDPFWSCLCTLRTVFGCCTLQRGTFESNSLFQPSRRVAVGLYSPYSPYSPSQRSTSQRKLELRPAARLNRCLSQIDPKRLIRIQKVAAQFIEPGGDGRKKITSSDDWWNFGRCATVRCKKGLVSQGLFCTNCLQRCNVLGVVFQTESLQCKSSVAQELFPCFLAHSSKDQ